MKKLCKLKNKDFKTNKEYIVSFSTEARYICKKCLRVANCKKVLCKVDDI